MDKLKVGITFIGYECMELMPRALKPWQDIRNGCLKIDEIESVTISLTHGCFEETAKLGFSIRSKDGSAEWMAKEADDKRVDNAFVLAFPAKEYDMWTMNYDRFKEEIDFMVMLNHDEMWTPDEIRQLFKYIAFNPWVDYYKVNFKNYCINENTWVSDFIVPRMWWTKKNSGLKRFYKDELVEYNNGKKDVECSFSVVPGITPKHLSWVGSKEYLKRKLNFQALRFGSCSYAWDEEKDCLKLNDDFYAKFPVPRPVLHHD
jgi:hypothetical protein